MSCLSPDALSHFEQREQELLARNQQLERRRAQALPEASGAPAGGAPEAAPRTPSAGAGAAGADADAAAPPEAGPGGAPPPRERGAEAAGRPPSGPGAPGAAPPRAAPPPSPGAGGGGAEGADEALQMTVRLQSARIAALQEELDRTIAELAGRDSENRQLKQDLKQAADENARLQRNAGPSESVQERFKRQLASAEAKIRDLESERVELLKTKDQFDLQTKKHAAESSTKDARINRLNEECEKHKQALREMGTQDKDRVASDRKEMDRLTGEVRKLERQRTELVGAFKKQMKLIDVLKRQRAHMEAARVLSFTEDEFIRILELGEKLGE